MNTTSTWHKEIRSNVGDHFDKNDHLSYKRVKCEYFEHLIKYKVGTSVMWKM